MHEHVIIGEGTPYPLNGILTLPDESSGKVPAVVLVHGSGPSDMDEHIGGNRPFHDIAEALPAKGIAVLRYDKRTRVYGKTMVKHGAASITVREETIDDAVLASRLLKSDVRIDPERVFIFGHSLGGLLAPRIDAEGGDFAGLIIAAGSLRSLAEIMIDQNEAVLRQLKGFLRTIAAKQMAGLKRKLESVSQLSEAEAKKTRIAGKVYAWYFKEMAEHPAAEFLLKSEKPTLILQGEKDVQVSVGKDFNLYRQLLEGKEHVQFRLYPELNHLFMKAVYATLKDLRKEYRIAQTVSSEVTDDVAAWILNGS